MRPIDLILVHPGAEDTQAAARSLAETWEIAEDVAQVALMLWIEAAIVVMVGEPKHLSSAKLDTAGIWAEAVADATRQKADQLGPWLPAEPLPAEPEQATGSSAQEIAELLKGGAFAAGRPEIESEVRELLAAAGVPGTLKVSRRAGGLAIYEMAEMPPAEVGERLALLIAEATRKTCSICGSPVVGPHPTLCAMCSSGMPPL